MANRYPWDRQDGERDGAKAAFDLYKNMGAGNRSYVKVAKALGHKNSNQISIWGRKFNWVKRAEAWDDHLQTAADKKTESEHAKAVADANKRHLALAKAFQQKVAQRIAALNPEELMANDLSRWFDLAVRIEREILGISGNNGAVDVGSDDGFIEALAGKVDDVWGDE
ncbi:MAG: hypothetical protein ACLT3C_00120 [Peptococcus niger]